MNNWNVTIVLFSISDYSDLYYDSEDGKLKYMRVYTGLHCHKAGMGIN